jgi:hypothetical protein
MTFLFAFCVTSGTVSIFTEEEKWNRLFQLAAWIAPYAHGTRIHAADVFPSKDRPSGPKKHCRAKPARYSTARLTREAIKTVAGVQNYRARNSSN